MDLFQTRESKRNWMKYIYVNLILTAIIAILGFFLNITVIIFQVLPSPIVWLFAVIYILVCFVIASFISSIAVFIKYLRKSMKVTKEDKGFTISKASESGRRQKGKSRKKR